MGSLTYYNGYSGIERMKKFDEMNRRIASNKLDKPEGPCELCGDPKAEVEYHDEDYSEPYRWDKPAAYALCKHCHVQKVHGRFRFPHRWKAFLAHIRRGGHASDLYGPDAKPKYREEFESCCEAVKAGKPAELQSLRTYKGDEGREWFTNLTLVEAAMSEAFSRPRP